MEVHFTVLVIKSRDQQREIPILKGKLKLGIIQKAEK